MRRLLVLTGFLGLLVDGSQAQEFWTPNFPGGHGGFWDDRENWLGGSLPGENPGELEEVTIAFGDPGLAEDTVVYRNTYRPDALFERLTIQGIATWVNFELSDDMFLKNLDLEPQSRFRHLGGTAEVLQLTVEGDGLAAVAPEYRLEQGATLKGLEDDPAGEPGPAFSGRVLGNGRLVVDGGTLAGQGSNRLSLEGDGDGVAMLELRDGIVDLPQLKVAGTKVSEVDVSGGTLRVRGHFAEDFDLGFRPVSNPPALEPGALARLRVRGDGAVTVKGVLGERTDLNVGDQFEGEVLQSGADSSVHVEGTLRIGSGAPGRYALSGGALTGTRVIVGKNVASSFEQTGGSVVLGASGDGAFTGTLLVGENDQEGNVYALDGGTLETTATTVAGFERKGRMTQAAGTGHVTDTLFVGGSGDGGEGSYVMSGGTLTTGITSTTGTFNQLDGTHVATERVNVSGVFNQSGGSLTAPLLETGGGGGEFLFSGGTLQLGAIDSFFGTFQHGAGQDVAVTGGVTLFGDYRMAGGGLDVGGGLRVVGAGKVFDLDGGDVDAASVSVEQGARFEQADGSVDVGSSGTLTVEGGVWELLAGSVEGDAMQLGGAGPGGGEARFEQGGGFVMLDERLVLGPGDTGAKGVYDFSGGNLVVPEIVVGKDGLGELVQTGTALILSRIVLGEGATGDGVFRVTGGGGGGVILGERLEIGDGGSGRWVQEDGSLDVNGVMVLGASAGGDGELRVLPDGEVEADEVEVGEVGAGTVRLEGGSFEAGSLSVGANGSVVVDSGSATVGGATVLAGPVTLEAGGAFTTATLDTGGDGSRLVWNGGALSLGASGLESGVASPLGDHGVLGGSRSLGVSGDVVVKDGDSLRVEGAAVVNAGGALVVEEGGSFEQVGGVIDVASATVFQEIGEVFQLSGGDFRTRGDFNFERDSSEDFATELRGTTKMRVDGDFIIGATGSDTAEWWQNGTSSVTIGGRLVVADRFSSTNNEEGYFLGGSGVVSCQEAVIGERGAGRFWQFSGTQHNVAGDVVLGGGSSGRGSYRMQGGTLTATHLRLGVARFTSGSVSHSGGTVAVSGQVEIGAGPGTNGNYRMFVGTGRVEAGALSIGAAAGSSGRFEQNGGAVVVSGAVVNDDEFVKNGGTFSAAGGFTNTGGMEVVGGGFVADVQNGGMLEPGQSPGTWELDGSLTNLAGGTLRLEIDGRPGDAGSWDRIEASGAVVLDGTLEVVWGGLTPESGDRWEVIVGGGGISGAFAALQLPVAELPVGGSLDVVVEAGRVVLVYTEGPAPKTLETWAGENGLVGDAAQPGADPDRDGRDNGYEFVTGGDPMRGGDAPNPVVDVEGEFVTVTLTKPEYLPSGVTVLIEFSDDMVSWDEAGVVVLVDDDERLQVRDATAAAAQAKRFVRVRVVLP